MTRKTAIFGVSSVVGFMVLSTIAMVAMGHEWVMPSAAGFFTETLGAIFWFCLGWLHGNRNR